MSKIIDSRLPERDEIEASLARKLQRRMNHYRRLFVEDFNGNINSIAPTFWRRMAVDLSEQVASTIRRIGFLQAKRFEIASDKARPIIQRVARERSSLLARELAHTGRDRIRIVKRRFKREEPDKISEVKEIAKSIFGSGRVSVIATTETTYAVSEFARRFAHLRFGPTKLIWRLQPCLHCTFCPAVDGTSKSVWGRYVAAPPAHPSCCCYIEIATADTKIKKGPNRSTLDKLAHESNVFGF